MTPVLQGGGGWRLTSPYPHDVCFRKAKKLWWRLTQVQNLKRQIQIAMLWNFQ